MRIGDPIPPQFLPQTQAAFDLIEDMQAVYDWDGYTGKPEGTGMVCMLLEDNGGPPCAMAWAGLDAAGVLPVEGGDAVLYSKAALMLRVDAHNGTKAFQAFVRLSVEFESTPPVTVNLSVVDEYLDNYAQKYDVDTSDRPWRE